MKKNLMLLVAVIVLAQTAVSQDITLRFTGVTTSGDYVRLESVRVSNVTRSWNEVVFYPDTILSFTLTGIADAQSLSAEVSAYPNPFNGATNVSVSVLQSEKATMQLYNLSGQKVAERVVDLETGDNNFEVRLKNPQLYILSVTTTQGSSSVKLLNRSCSSENSIISRGAGSFVAKRQSWSPFQIGDELSIVGYATGADFLPVSHQIIQPQTSGENFTLVFDTVPTGALPGLFSVGTNKYVLFSRGNLQWSASGTHATADSTAHGTWRFAPNQWDTIGHDNVNIDSAYTGWIDLFTWGTSCWNSGANAYQPYSTNNTYLDYNVGGSYYNDLTGSYANADWGVFNAISNGGNRPGMWRTLTNKEWDTLINYRSTASGIRYVKALVNNVLGIILVPDNWNSSYPLDAVNTFGIFDCDTVTAADWVTLENAGCAFLPATGMAYHYVPYHLNNVGSKGYYWSSTNSAAGSSGYALEFSNPQARAGQSKMKYIGIAVRLVQDVP